MGVKHLLTVDTDYNGKTLTIRVPEGVIECVRVDPHGVVLIAAGYTFNLPKGDLATIAEFFAAAAVMLGQELNPSPGPVRGFPGAY